MTEDESRSEGNSTAGKYAEAFTAGGLGEGPLAMLFGLTGMALTGYMGVRWIANKRGGSQGTGGMVGAALGVTMGIAALWVKNRLHSRRNGGDRID